MFKNFIYSSKKYLLHWIYTCDQYRHSFSPHGVYNPKYLLSDFYVLGTEVGTGVNDEQIQPLLLLSKCLECREEVTSTKYMSHANKCKATGGKCQERKPCLCYYQDFTSTERSLELNSGWWIVGNVIKGKEQRVKFLERTAYKGRGPAS